MHLPGVGRPREASRPRYSRTPSRKRRRVRLPLAIGGRRLSRLSDEQILDLRFCDLSLSLEGTMVERCIQLLYNELEARSIRFRPHFWISNEFFSPDGVPGIAVPFYLAHPRLRRLENAQMLEVEGGTKEWCLKILRHEAGHAIDTAYGLRRKRRWIRTFGKSSVTYPRYYTPKPYSKDFVLHLDWWYAQSHPLEDFAETFAVWLAPGQRWKSRYRKWPAMEKLLYVDELMAEIGPKQPPVASLDLVDPASRMRKSLRSHYRERRDHYGQDFPDVYDRDLKRIFAMPGTETQGESASRFLSRKRKIIRENVSRWTGQHAYTIDLVLKEMIARSRALELRVDRPESEVQVSVVLLVTVQVMNFLHSGYHRIAL